MEYELLARAINWMNIKTAHPHVFFSKTPIFEFDYH